MHHNTLFRHTVKLGHKNEEPEFSDMAYFSMLFSAGVGVGLFFYGVSEPLWHQGSNYYANAGKCWLVQLQSPLTAYPIYFPIS